MRVEADPVLPSTHANNPEDDRLPQTAQRSHVNAARGMTGVLGQIDLTGLPDVT
jgi:hypothetical protein